MLPEAERMTPEGAEAPLHVSLRVPQECFTFGVFAARVGVLSP
jgi:hypothetical protein